jgi:2'-5' RNA ligase
MQRKIFIGVALDPAVKKRLMQKIQKWKDLPIRWSREENLHLNLITLGHIDDDIIYDICNKVNKALADVDIFDIDMDEIELSPIADKNAKMVNFSGPENEKLKFVCEKIEKELGIFSHNKKVFRPTIALGRIQQYGWQKLEVVPMVEEKFTVLLPIESIEIFESAIIEGKRKFSSIESCALNV